MENKISSRLLAKSLRCCVLIPTYNNQRTVLKVIEDALDFCEDVIVVNDGATDQTGELIKSVSSKIQLVTFSQNKGKGKALQAGFAKAKELGFEYVITIDSDGQHFASDIPLFLEHLKNKQTTNPLLLVGSRNLSQEGVPAKSNFGNKFSNFWYTLETGIKLTDTQSGYRLYPVNMLADKFYFTSRFEFEIEVLVRAAWAGAEVKNIPIRVHYGEDRVSHFRPFKDFTRISLLNTVLVLITFLYIKPRDFIRNIRRKEYRKEIWNKVIDTEESNLKKTFAIAYGVFIGIFPIWGYQLAAGIPLAYFLRLNVPIVFISANISIPPLNIIWWYLSFRLGKYFVSNPDSSFQFSWDINLEALHAYFMQFFVGGVALALLAASVAWIISFILLSVFRKTTTKSITTP